MQNNYAMKNDHAVIEVFVKKERRECLVDKESLDKLLRLDVRWNGATYGNRIYAIAHIKKNGKGTTIKMHRFITSAPKGRLVDHKNHNTLDNRDKNLRVCSQSENQQNLQGAKSHSKTGIRGVHWNKKDKKWVAKLSINGKGIYVGSFIDVFEAEKAVKEARRKYMPFSKEGMENERSNQA